MNNKILCLAIFFIVLSTACAIPVFQNSSLDSPTLELTSSAVAANTVSDVVSTIVVDSEEICSEDGCDDEQPIQIIETTPLPSLPHQTSDENIGNDTLYFGLMIHLEGWNDDKNQRSFEEHAQIVRQAASLFETYGAKLTFESKEFTPGSIRWGDNVLYEMEQRGHAVGVHADIGGQKNYSCQQMVSDLCQKKEELETLGVTVRHVSGIVSHCDWVRSAAEAGYEFTSGTVRYALVSLAEDLLPEDFEGCASPAACHQPYPPDLKGRLHPWRAESAKDWIKPDPKGRLVILPASGGLVCMAEEAASQDSQTKCDFDMTDVDAFQSELDTALTLVEGSKVNMYYLSWSIGKAQDPVLLEAFLQRLQPYIDSGKVQWATLPDMYDKFVLWEEAKKK